MDRLKVRTKLGKIKPLKKVKKTAAWRRGIPKVGDSTCIIMLDIASTHILSQQSHTLKAPPTYSKIVSTGRTVKKNNVSVFDLQNSFTYFVQQSTFFDSF